MVARFFDFSLFWVNLHPRVVFSFRFTTNAFFFLTVVTYIPLNFFVGLAIFLLFYFNVRFLRVRVCSTFYILWWSCIYRNFGFLDFFCSVILVFFFFDLFRFLANGFFFIPIWIVSFATVFVVFSLFCYRMLLRRFHFCYRMLLRRFHVFHTCRKYFFCGTVAVAVCPTWYSAKSVFSTSVHSFFSNFSISHCLFLSSLRASVLIVHIVSSVTYCLTYDCFERDCVGGKYFIFSTHIKRIF